MKKVLIGSAIVFFMIFTAGFATAASTFPWTGTSGTVWFVDNAGVVTEDDTPTIELNLAAAIPDEPKGIGRDLYWGTLTYTDPVDGTTPVTVAFTAVKGEGGIYSLNGASGATDVRAELKFTSRRNPGAHNHLQTALEIRGAILGGTAFSFEGAFFK